MRVLYEPIELSPSDFARNTDNHRTDGTHRRGDAPVPKDSKNEPSGTPTYVRGESYQDKQ